MYPFNYVSFNPETSSRQQKGIICFKKCVFPWYLYYRWVTALMEQQFFVWSCLDCEWWCMGETHFTLVCIHLHTAVRMLCIQNQNAFMRLSKVRLRMNCIKFCSFYFVLFFHTEVGWLFCWLLACFMLLHKIKGILEEAHLKTTDTNNWLMIFGWNFAPRWHFQALQLNQQADAGSGFKHYAQKRYFSSTNLSKELT